jgi:hypothetical protein
MRFRLCLARACESIRGRGFLADVIYHGEGGNTMNTGMKNRLVLTALFLAAIVIMGGAYESFAQEKEPLRNVLNLFEKPIGAVDEEGTIMNLFGTRLGSVDSNGSIYNVSNLFVGKVDESGNVFNQSGTRVGSVDGEGNVYNVSGRKVGSVDAGGNLILIGGAARILFF